MIDQPQIKWLDTSSGREFGTLRKNEHITHRLHAWLHTMPGRMIVIGFFTVVLAGLAWSMLRYLGPNAAQRYSAAPLFIDSVTGQTFHYQLKIGDTIPVLSPFTHRNTGYPAAFSYWSKGGHILKHPEPVLLNSWIGKRGPTFAPLSGRLVVAAEKPPRPGSRPPPTKQQYEKWVDSRYATSAGGN
jgi:hypothetical protein